MDFIEREKLRVEEEQKKKESEEKTREEIVKRKKIELQNKRDSIYKKLGPFMEQLLQKTNEKQRQAEAEKLQDPIDDLFHSEDFKGWKWEIDWLNTTPRLWGHFEIIKDLVYNDGDDKECYKNAKFDTVGNSEVFKTYSFNGANVDILKWTIFIQCLFDIERNTLRIRAIAKDYNKTIFHDENDRIAEHSKSLQAPYLGNKGLIIPITKDASLIDRIADTLIEIRYTWKCQLAEQINNLITIIKLESSLKLYDNTINEKNEKLETIKQKKRKEKISDIWSPIIGIISVITFLIWIIHDKAGFFSIIGNLIVGGIISFIGFFIILGITKSIFILFKYGYSTKEIEKDNLIIKNYETKISHKNSEISDLLKNLKATIDKNNIDEFVGDEIILEFSLTDEFVVSDLYTKEDFISKIENMIKRSKYEEKSD